MIVITFKIAKIIDKEKNTQQKYTRNIDEYKKIF